MSRFTTWSSPNWVNAYYWVYENGVIVTDAFNLDDWAWTTKAACQGTDPESFFETDSAADRSWLVHLCSHCPVRIDCLTHAMTHDEVGWWGGMTRTDRRRLQAGRDG